MKLNRIKAVLEEKGISQTWLSKQRLISDVGTGQIRVAEPQKGEQQ